MSLHNFLIFTEFHILGGGGEGGARVTLNLRVYQENFVEYQYM